ncbi:MAG: hypothetical protein CMP61_00510 [Flavobacteriales bacterium]|nr:hypothetical protein [Flavobacteriales bacterium]
MSKKVIIFLTLIWGWRIASYAQSDITSTSDTTNTDTTAASDLAQFLFNSVPDDLPFVPGGPQSRRINSIPPDTAGIRKYKHDPNKVILPIRHKTGEWQYINILGRICATDSFEEASLPYRPMEVIIGKGRKYGVLKYEPVNGNTINVNFKEYLNYDYDSIIYDNRNYILKSNNSFELFHSLEKKTAIKADSIKGYKEYFKIWKNGNVGLYNDSCEQLIPIQYDFIRKLSNDFILVGNRNQSYRVLCLNNKQFLPGNYDMIALKNDSVLRVKRGNNWSYYRTDLSRIPYTNSQMLLFNEHGYYKVQQDSTHWLLYDFQTGENLFGSRFMNYYPQSRKSFTVLNENGVGMIDSIGNQIIPNKYHEVTMLYSDSLFLVQKEFEYGVVNLKNEEIIPLQHSLIRPIKVYAPEMLLLAADSGRKTMYDLNGKIIVPGDYEDIHFRRNFMLTVKAQYDSITKKQRPPLFGAYSIKGKKLSDAKYRMMGRFGWNLTGFLSKDTTIALFTKNEPIFTKKIIAYTSFRDVIKCYTKDSIFMMYVDSAGFIEGKFGYQRKQTLRFMHQPSMPEFKSITGKVAPMPISTVYFSQMDGAWSAKHNYSKKLLGKKLFYDVSSSKNGYVIRHTDSVMEYSIANAKFESLEPLGQLGNWGGSNLYSVTFDFKFFTPKEDRSGLYVNHSNILLPNGKFKFLTDPTNHEYPFINSTSKSNFVHYLHEGKLKLTTKNPSITLEKFYTNYNGFKNLVPKDYATQKLLADDELGIAFENPRFGFKINTKSGINYFGEKPFPEYMDMPDNYFSVKMPDGEYRVVRKVDFKDRDDRDDALSRKYYSVKNLVPELEHFYDSTRGGFIYQRQNYAYTFIDSVSKIRTLDKYYKDIKDIQNDTVLIRETDFYQLMDLDEKLVNENAFFKKVTKFNSMGCFAGGTNSSLAIYNKKGERMSDKEYWKVKFSKFELFLAYGERGAGYLKPNGDTLTRMNFEIIKDFNDFGVAVVKDDKFFYVINTKGEAIYKSKSRIKRAINNEFAVFKKKGLSKLISLKTGKIIKTPKINIIYTIVDSIVSYSFNNKKKMYSLKKKKRVSRRNYINKGFNDQNGFAVITYKGFPTLVNSDFKPIKILKKASHRDLKGVIECTLDNGKETSYINYRGEDLNIPEEYYIPDSFQGAYAIIERYSKRGVIDTNGRIIVEPIYDHITIYKDGKFVVRKDKKTGLLNANKEWLLSQSYARIKVLKNNGKSVLTVSPIAFTGYSRTHKDSRGPNGEVERGVPAVYDKIDFVSSHILRISTHEGKFGYIYHNSNSAYPIWDLNK